MAALAERYRRPRGMVDILPDEGWRREDLRRRWWHLVALYGYGPIETPVVEQTAVFTDGVGAGTDIVRHERYTFVDAGGLSLTLRPEATAAVARAFVEQGLASWPQPVRLAYWMPMFRRERPERGRYRQHWQYGVELWGSAAPAADVEVVSVAMRFLRQVGVAPRLQINALGCDACRPAYRQALIAYYAPLRETLCPDCQARWSANPLRLLDCKRDEGAKAGAPDMAEWWCADCRAHWDAVTAGLDALGIAWERQPRLVRGLDYYTRTVFEIVDAADPDRALLGGGRYDGLTARWGDQPRPAVGFGGGVERLLLALPDAEQPPPTGVTVAYRAELATAALALAEACRDADLPVWLASADRSLKAQLREAARRSRWAMIVTQPDAVTVRDLETGAEETTPVSAAVATLLGRLQGLGR